MNAILIMNWAVDIIAAAAATVTMEAVTMEAVTKEAVDFEIPMDMILMTSK